MARDIGDADRVAFRQEVVHLEAGKATFGQLAFVRLVLLVKLFRREMVEGFGLNAGQVEPTKLVVKSLSHLLGGLGQPTSWLAGGFMT